MGKKKAAGMKKYIAILIILILLTIGKIGFNRQQILDRNIREIDSLRKIAPPKDSIELVKIGSFPTAEQELSGIYIARADSMAIDDKKQTLFISDQKANVVLKFSFSGDYLGKIGRPGQGPGEFSLPRSLVILNNELIVYDAGNMRLQYFDLQGNFKKSIRLFKTFIDIKITDNGYIIGAPLSVETYQNESLINLLSPEGKLIYSFGEPINFKYDQSTLNNRTILPFDQDKIYLIFQFLPIVRCYSLERDLIFEKKLETELSFQKEKINLRNNSYRPKERVGYINILYPAKIIDKNIYILDSMRPFIRIWEFNLELKRGRTFWAKLEASSFIRDFVLAKKEGETLFYLLGNIGDEGDKIHIFKINKSMRRK